MDFYYMDRPVVPATQQVSVNISGILEHGVSVKLDELNGEWIAKAVEVKDDQGDVVGSLFYVPSIDYETLIVPEGVDNVETEPSTPNQELFNFLGETVSVDADTADMLEEIEGYISVGDDAQTDVVSVPMSFLEEVGKHIVHLQKRNNNQYEMLTNREQGFAGEGSVDSEVSI